jgi:hypothetical protein
VLNVGSYTLLSEYGVTPFYALSTYFAARWLLVSLRL